MNYTFIALVENKPGVLNRVASLFRRRNFNIESLAVGRTDNPEVSRMTIVVDCPNGDVDAHRIEANLCNGAFVSTTGGILLHGKTGIDPRAIQKIRTDAAPGALRCDERYIDMWRRDDTCIILERD